MRGRNVSVTPRWCFTASSVTTNNVCSYLTSPKGLILRYIRTHVYLSRCNIILEVVWFVQTCVTDNATSVTMAMSRFQCEIPDTTIQWSEYNLSVQLMVREII